MMTKSENKNNLERLETIISIAPGHIYWKDSNGSFLGCNDEQARTFNLSSAKDVLGKTDYDFYGKEQAEAIVQADQRIMLSGETTILEEPVTLLDGRSAVFLSKKVPLRNKRNEIIGIIGVSVDITERKVMEAELASAKERIESMRLVSASIAHELRTPLNSIKSFVAGLKAYLPDLMQGYELAKNASLDVPPIRAAHIDILKKGIDGINVQVDHASLVIDMLLTNLSFRKIDKQKFEQQSIVECVEEALAIYPFTAQERSLIHWSCDIDFQFLGSKVLIIQVLLNILKNAVYSIAAARRGEIKLWVENGLERNRLYIEDTARGISPDAIPHIFDKFFTKDTDHGTGIGLAFCKMCMQEHGGDIDCESEEGVYARFILTFPNREGKFI
jgi:PAS domain S-box-containing protein